LKKKTIKKKISPNKKLSLYPLEFDEALSDILSVKPAKNKKKIKNKKSR
jgi:hypothetical protein